MKNPFLSLLIAAALMPAGAFAQTKEAAQARADAEAARQEMKTVREEMAALSKRMAELARQTQADVRRDVRIERIFASGPQRPVIGVLLGTDRDGHVQLTGATPEGPAAKAGLRAGDRLLRVGGKAIAGDTPEARLDSTRALLGHLENGQEVTLTYQRDGKAQDVTLSAQTMKGTMVVRSHGQGEGHPVDLPGGEHFAFVSPHMELGQLAPFAGCGDEQDCGFKILTRAFRWQGLNLATVDAQLGRYFGTDHGVLVLRAGDELGQLQPGDVLLTIGGVEVASPREAMRELADKPAGEKVAIELLRDRRKQTVEITAPEASRALEMLAPPSPPLPPPPPAAPKAPKAPKPPQGAALVELRADSIAHAPPPAPRAPMPLPRVY
jgi:hypothetical protein